MFWEVQHGSIQIYFTGFLIQEDLNDLKCNVLNTILKLSKTLDFCSDTCMK